MGSRSRRNSGRLIRVKAKKGKKSNPIFPSEKKQLIFTKGSVNKTWLQRIASKEYRGNRSLEQVLRKERDLLIIGSGLAMRSGELTRIEQLIVAALENPQILLDLLIEEGIEFEE